MPYRPDPADIEWYVRTRIVLRYAGDPAKGHADAIAPYLDALLRMTIPVPVKGIGASISSDRTRVYADPVYRNANDPADNAACALHEVAGHMFAGHLDRFAAGEFVNHSLANIAGDLASNQMVFAMAARHPNAIRPSGVRFANADGSPLAPAAFAAAVRQTKWLHPLLYGFAEGLTMEEYYALLLQQAAQREKEKQAGPPDGKGGQGERGEAGEKGGKGDEPSDANGNGPQGDADDADGSQGDEGSDGASAGDSGGGQGSGSGEGSGDDAETDSGEGSGSGSGSGGQGSQGSGGQGDGGSFVASARDPIADALGEGGCGKGACGACGGDPAVSDRHRQLAEAQHGDLPEGASDTDLRAARKEVAAAVLAHAAQYGQGSVPAGLLRVAQGVLAPPKVRWERVLAGIVQGVVSAATAGQSSTTYARPSRRAPPGFVFPGSVTDRVDVAVVADTSGSMGDDDLRRVLAETKGVLALPAVNRVWWIPTDASPDKAREVRSVKSARDRLIGGGGTDMGAGLAEAANVRPRVPLTVVLTDGLTGWPKARPRCGKVVVVLTRPSSGPTPEWVYRVVPAY